MSYLTKQTSFMLSTLALGVAAISTQAYAAQIQAINATQSSANVTQLRIAFDGAPISPVAYQQAGSNQLMLDFAQVSSPALARNMTINTGAISNVVALNNGSVTRLVVNLNTAATYSTRLEGNELVLEVVSTGTASPMGQTRPQTMNVKVNPLLVPSNAQVANLSNEGVSAISYSPSAGGGGSVSVSLTNEAIPVDVQRQGNKIVIRTTGSTLPRHLVRRLNAGGLVSNIDATNQGKNGLIVINMSGDYEYQAYQSGSQLNVSVRPADLLREPTLEEKVYKGEPLSMEFQDIPVRTVLDVLAKYTELNIVASDTVSGNITLRLRNVPWDQALDIILASKNLDKRTNGNIVFVAPAAELARQEADKLKAVQEAKTLAPLRTEYIRLNYAKAPDVLTLITQSRNSGSATTANTNETSLLSVRGSVTIDQRTNTLIVKDTTESINNIRKLIDKIDIPVRQVMIEARIVSASDGFSKQLGVQWGLVHDSSRSNRRFQIGGSRKAMWDMRSGDNKVTFDGNQSRGGRSSDLAVDFGVVGANAASISFGLLNIADSILDLELSALQADNRGEVISSPKVLTADKQKARIESGTQIPFQEASASGATTTSWINAALALEATPNITPDGKIGLQLLIENESPSVAPNGGMAISGDSIQTNVILEDGQTVVLGGVFRNNITNNENKVPFLGDLPYVGRLFKSQNRRNEKEELLIFITPKLVNDGISRIN